MGKDVRSNRNYGLCTHRRVIVEEENYAVLPGSSSHDNANE